MSASRVFLFIQHQTFLFLRSINVLLQNSKNPHLRLFRRAMFAVHLGQYHLPFGGAVIPTQG